MFCYSALVHLGIWFLLLNFQFSAKFTEAPIYYVDLLSLPVASPQAGQTAAVQPVPAPDRQAAPAPREMALPSKPSVKIPAPATKVPAHIDPPESDREFAERIARMERDREERRQEAALEALRKRTASSGPVGMPGATGTEAGSEYASYVQSRLKDAFRTTIAFQSKNPEVLLRMTISRSGRIARVKMERSTGDKVFEDAVTRAIAKAEKTIPPPPRGQDFETGFVFRPTGVGKN